MAADSAWLCGCCSCCSLLLLLPTLWWGHVAWVGQDLRWAMAPWLRDGSRRAKRVGGSLSQAPMRRARGRARAAAAVPIMRTHKALLRAQNRDAPRLGRCVGEASGTWMGWGGAALPALSRRLACGCACVLDDSVQRLREASPHHWRVCQANAGWLLVLVRAKKRARPCMRDPASADVRHPIHPINPTTHRKGRKKGWRRPRRQARPAGGCAT